LPAGLTPLVAAPGSGPLIDALAQRRIRTNSLGRIDKFGIPALVDMIKREGASLVYGNSAHTVSRNALVAAKFCGVPFVYHLREMARPGGWRHQVRLFPWADAAIAVSAATAESYAGSFREPPCVVHNGVSLDRYQLDRVACRTQVAEELGFDETAPLVIQVGNVYARKGQRMALAVLRELLSTFPECRLVMVGRLDRDPGYVESLRALIREHGLGARAILTGLRPDVPTLLAAADVFLHTALEDPHPRAVIEAMAAGLPVVALAVDGVAETVADMESGILVSLPSSPKSLARPVAKLLASPEDRQRMGERGRDRVRAMFSADRTADRVVTVIRRLLGPE